MEFVIVNEIKSKEILEQLENVIEFQDEYIDSYIQEIAAKLSKESGTKVDEFSDQVWMNSYIIFKKGDLDIFKSSFDKYVKSFEDEEPTENFKDTLSQLQELLPEQFIMVIEYTDGIESGGKE